MRLLHDHHKLSVFGELLQHIKQHINDDDDSDVNDVVNDTLARIIHA